MIAREQGRGIGPALALFHAGKLAGAEVSDRIVGRAAAAVFVLSGAAQVRADVMSEGAARFLDHLKLAEQAVHVADIRTLALHPASSTHRQLNDEMLKAAGVTPGLIRFSVGCENIDDIIADIRQALEYV